MSAKRAALAAQIAALRAQMEAEDEPGIYEEPNGFFRIVRLPGGRQTTRRRARDGSRLPSRDQAVRGKAEWEEAFEAGTIVVAVPASRRCGRRTCARPRPRSATAPGRTCARTARCGCCP